MTELLINNTLTLKGVPVKGRVKITGFRLPDQRNFGPTRSSKEWECKFCWFQITRLPIKEYAETTRVSSQVIK